AYWGSRMGRHPELPPIVARLLRQQGRRCAECGLIFTTEERVEIDHRVPRSAGGTGTRANLQLLHGHCHDAKTARDLATQRARTGRGTHDRRRPTEEPDEVKVSRPVLKTSRAG